MDFGVVRRGGFHLRHLPSPSPWMESWRGVICMKFKDWGIYLNVCATEHLVSLSLCLSNYQESGGSRAGGRAGGRVHLHAPPSRIPLSLNSCPLLSYPISVFPALSLPSPLSFPIPFPFPSLLLVFILFTTCPLFLLINTKPLRMTRSSKSPKAPAGRPHPRGEWPDDCGPIDKLARTVNNGGGR